MLGGSRVNPKSDGGNRRASARASGRVSNLSQYYDPDYISVNQLNVDAYGIKDPLDAAGRQRRLYIISSRANAYAELDRRMLGLANRWVYNKDNRNSKNAFTAMTPADLPIEVPGIGKISANDIFSRDGDGEVVWAKLNYETKGKILAAFQAKLSKDDAKLATRGKTFGRVGGVLGGLLTAGGVTTAIVGLTPVGVGLAALGPIGLGLMGAGILMALVFSQGPKFYAKYKASQREKKASSVQTGINKVKKDLDIMYSTGAGKDRSKVANDLYRYQIQANGGAVNQSTPGGSPSPPSSALPPGPHVRQYRSSSPAPGSQQQSQGRDRALSRQDLKQFLKKL